jgi:hypothetical protein
MVVRETTDILFSETLEDVIPHYIALDVDGITVPKQDVTATRFLIWFNNYYENLLVDFNKKKEELCHR